MKSGYVLALCLALGGGVAVGQEAGEVLPEVLPEVLIERLMAAPDQASAAWRSDLVSLVSEPEAAFAPLLANLKAAEGEEALVTATYLMHIAVSQNRLPGRAAAALPEGLVDELKRVLEGAESFALKANVLQLSGTIGPDALPLAPLIFKFMREEEEPVARGTAQAVLGRLGAGVLPLVRGELRASNSERYSGDLAGMLRGVPLEAGEIAKITTLLEAGSAETRRAAIQALKGRDVPSEALARAARRNIDDALSDQARMMAGADLFGLEGADDIKVRGLSEAVLAMDGSNGRRQVAQMLGALTPEGPRALALILRKDISDAARGDVLQMLVMMARPDEAVALVLLDEARERPPSREAALVGLRRMGPVGRDVIESALDGITDSDLRARLAALAAELPTE